MFIITGGGSGIGQALAIALADCQQTVLIIGRREHALQATAQHAPHLIKCFSADLAQPTERHRCIQYIRQFPTLSGLVHNAATIEPIIALADIQESAWQQAQAINLDAPLFLTQALLPQLTQGRVLHIGSGAAYFPIVGWGSYCVFKAALAMLTRCWQAESTDIAFASVMPGIIDTDMQAIIRASQQMAEDKHAFFMRLKQQQQLLSVATVARFLCWLLLEVDSSTYQAQEWDIYDKTHHLHWLRPPHVVPAITE